MHLTSLSISGFKSFAIDTKIEFAGGITSVVGPNGCGKSNVVDSLRWVLGEQRSSVLRGDRMENVIFNGTNHRKPLNLAEVKVVVNNESGRINLPYTEIEIARRLHRDGTSEYLLNGNACRLRDITDLLHDSGMGPNMYSILELKMVESILRDEGEGRRQLFEEASGIAKYKMRRRQAQMKLQQTEDDLLRLADIIHEVERQVASLKRQVSRAKRYKEYSAQLKTMESALMYRRYEKIKNELIPLESAMQQSTDSTEAVKSALRSEEAKLEEMKRQLVESEQSTSAFRKRLEEIVSTISTLEAEEAGHRATVQAAQETIQRTDRQRILATEKKETLERRESEQSLQREAVTGELEEAERVLGSAQEYYDGLLNALREREGSYERHIETLHETRRQHAQATGSRTDSLARKASISGKRESATHAIQSISEERERNQHELEALTVRKTAAHEFESEKLGETLRLREALAALVERKERMTDELRQLRSAENSRRSKLELLTTLEEKGPRSSVPIKKLRDSQIPGLMNLLGDAVNVEEKYRRALQGILGSAAYYFIASDEHAAAQAIDHLRSEQSGRATLIPLSGFVSPEARSFILPEGALCKAIDLIRHEGQDAVLRHFLGGVVIVEDWNRALNLSRWAKENDCTLVTLDGEWIASTGMLYGGSAETRQPVDLGLSAQREELKQSLSETRAQIETLEVELESLMRQIRENEVSVKSGDSELDKARAACTQLREQEVRLNTLIHSLDGREADARTRVEECDVQIEQLSRQVEVAEAEIADLNTRLKQEELAGEEIAEQLKYARDETSASREQLHQRERARDAVRHRLLLLDAELERIGQALADLAETQAQNEQAAEKAANDIVRLRSRLEVIERDLAERFKLRDERALEVDNASQILDGVRGRIAEQEAMLRRLRSGQEDALAGERKLSMDVARLQGEMEALLTNARNQYNLDPSSPDFLEQHPDLVGIEADPDLVQDLKQKIDNIGPVNLMAVEEFEQENTRLEGMLKNREDLLQAKATLEETIRKINETAEAKFLHTFEAVRSNFQGLFLEFFPAGEADLILSGKDLLEADITIWANPSGKRLKSLSLMSGGEKTMTAIALLFSLHRVTPPPFCVLDEVDAPLDDTNIDRFTRMLRHHSKETQFILITHNKRTMEIADNLYGVTMQEEGVSKLVSVRLLREREPVETE